MRKPIYLDYAATTPVDPRVAEKICECLTLDGNFANPASRSHVYGWKAEEAVENARAEVASLINADPREVVWTSGATESNNLALKGAAQARSQKGKHIVTSLIEHKAVLDPCKYLESQGFEVSYLEPDSNGFVSVEQLKAAIREDTILVSFMLVNNEIGVVSDVSTFGKLCREKGVLLHVDAAQAPGRVKIDVSEMNIDLMSLSAHKMYGPKGIGALYVRRSPEVSIHAQIHGGGHERGMRSGTLPTHQIVGMGEAARIASTELGEDVERIRELRDRFLNSISSVPDITIHGSMESRVVGNLNIGFSGVDGETLLMSLRDLALSTGSACTSVSVEPSYVLRAIGVPAELAHSSLRISFGRFTSEEDVDFAAQKITDTLSKLRLAS